MSRTMTGVALAVLLAPAAAQGQINFQKTGYYAAMGDSVAAGEGAMPVTTGYVYRLYDQGTFGQKQATDFSNLAVRGARSWEFRDHQVAQLLCAQPAQRPTVVTITAGANDFLKGDTNIVGIALRVREGINRLLNNGTGWVSETVIDPRNGAVCPPLANVTILVSNYASIPHPDPYLNALLDNVLSGFDQALRGVLASVNVPAGSKLKVVDVYTPSIGREGLLLIQRQFGYTGGFDFDAHPTNEGHAFIAAQFAAAWQSLK
jgi:lysophospholipase L1-like esterase